MSNEWSGDEMYVSFEVKPFKNKLDREYATRVVEDCMAVGMQHRLQGETHTTDLDSSVLYRRHV